MKKFILALTAACFVFCATQAKANIFFGIRGGIEKYKIENNNLKIDGGETDYLMAGFLGYHTGFFRLEAEYMYHPRRRLSDFKDETQTVMGNLYFSPPIKSWLHPYLMGGAGVAFHSMTLNEEKKKDHTFSWQAGLGLELEFANNVFIDVGGRLVDYGRPEHNDEKFDTNGYLYYLGLRLEY